MLPAHVQFGSCIRAIWIWERVSKSLRDHRFSVGQDGLKRGRREYDAGKKIKGRKRHIAVDTQGNVLTAVVHSEGKMGWERGRC